MFARKTVRTTSRVALLCALVLALGLAGPPALSDSHADSSHLTGELGGREMDDDQPQRRTSDNPLAGRAWGTYLGNSDMVARPYLSASAEEQAVLAKIALAPRVQWFGNWTGHGQRFVDQVRKYILTATGGDPEVMVQIAFFAVKPWNKDACRRLPTTAEKRSYRALARSLATAIGSTHTMLVMQPDGPFAACAPGASPIYSKLIKYGVRTLSALPNTHVYIDIGAEDWLKGEPQRAVNLLLPAGIEHARGFALNGTHYGSTENQVNFSAAVSTALAAAGLPGKTSVVNTSQNGRPFQGYTYRGPNFDHVPVCNALLQTNCVALGIPPTVDVANPAWGLTPTGAANAAAYVDAYLWIGRPWLYNQNKPFLKSRALELAANSPY